MEENWFVSELMKRNGKPRKWNGMNLWMEFLFAGVNEVESISRRTKGANRPRQAVFFSWIIQLRLGMESQQLINEREG